MRPDAARFFIVCIFMALPNKAGLSENVDFFFESRVKDVSVG